MPRLKRVSKSQRREKKKTQKRQAREESKDKEGLIFPPEKSESESELFTECTRNGLNFPKKPENGLNFPKKSESAEEGLKLPAKCCSDSVPKPVSDAGLNFVKCFPNECLNIYKDFDETFADAFSNAVAKRHCRIHKELYENEEVILLDTDSEITGTDSQLHVALNSKDSLGGILQVSDKTVPERTKESASDRTSDNDNQLERRLSSSIWNAGPIIYGSFHQNDKRFLELSRGFQCTCNALCMLTYSSCHEIDNSLVLDEILYDGDTLYKRTINNLKAQAKFVHSLLSLEEIPDIIEIEKGQFIVKKQPIVSGILVNDYEEQGLPILHCALQSAFTRAPSVLLVIGAICSAVSKKNDLYVFFDSHSHGKNGLSSSDGSSILMYFSCLEDLISYLYDLYDSMANDMSLQFDLMPVTVKRDEQMFGHKNNSESLLEAYFKDQNLRQQGKAQSNENSTSAFKEKFPSQKKKGRKQYYMIFKRNIRKRPGVLAKERDQKQLARQDPNFKAQERAQKQLARQDPNFKAQERTEKKLARQDPKFKARERAEKRLARQNPKFKANELVHQRSSKQSARKRPGTLEKERTEKHLARQDPNFKANELVHQRSSKQSARKRPGTLEEERMEKQLARQDPSFKANELVHKRSS